MQQLHLNLISLELSSALHWWHAGMRPSAVCWCVVHVHPIASSASHAAACCRPATGASGAGTCCGRCTTTRLSTGSCSSARRCAGRRTRQHCSRGLMVPSRCAAHCCAGSLCCCARPGLHVAIQLGSTDTGQASGRASISDHHVAKASCALTGSSQRSLQSIFFSLSCCLHTHPAVPTTGPFPALTVFLLLLCCPHLPLLAPPGALPGSCMH